MLPSYVWAFKLTTSSAAPTITIGGSFLVNKASYNFRLPYSGVKLLQKVPQDAATSSNFVIPTCLSWAPNE